MPSVTYESQQTRMTDYMSPSQPKAELPTERIPISKARSMFGQLVNRVYVDKAPIVLEKSGLPVVALVDIDEFKQYLAFRDGKKV